ncbi:MAG: FlgD immunoglobulin-like domain containing protein [Candidatus Delongbacteria bacterium]
MRLALLLLLPSLAALAQPLPLAWPDQPDGTVLFVRHDLRFQGSATAVDDAHWITAWCDMRDGRARLFLQKLDATNPAAPAWHSAPEGLGPVDALAGPPAALTPFMPVLAPDGAGGAFVLWQDVTSENAGDLFLQRVTDGGGQGAFQWGQDLLLAEDVPLPVYDCGDAANRCRSMSDEYRQLAADGLGGAWVAWRAADQFLHLMHVDGQGLPDPDFPADGLTLPVNAWDFKLLGDGLGNALLAHSAELGIERPLGVLGVRPDAGWLWPGGTRLLGGESLLYFSCRPAGAGRTLAAWTTETGLRAQLLDAGLEDLWQAGGVLLEDYGPRVVRVASGGAADQPHVVAWEDPTGNWLAQVLDGDGHQVWAAPAPLDVVADGSNGELYHLAVDAHGPAYLFEEGDGLHVQRLSAGQQLWSAEQSRLGPTGQSGHSWDFALRSDGGILTGWSAVESDGQAEHSRHQLSHRNLLGQEQLEPAAAAFLAESWQSGGATQLGMGGERPLLTWSAAGTLYLASVDGHSGQRRWDYTERPVGTQAGPYDMVSLAVDDELWLCGDVLLPEQGVYQLQLSRVDAQGQLLLTPVDLAPAEPQLPGYYEQYRPQLAWGGDRLFVGYDLLAGNQLRARLQCLDAAGSRLWGDSGRPVGLSTDTQTTLLGLATQAGGEVVAVWTRRSGTDTQFYLQRFSPAGEPLIADNSGRGIRLDLNADYLSFSGQVLPQPNGTLLLSLGDTMDDQNTRWRVLCLTSAGDELWRHEETGAALMAMRVLLDDQQRVWLGRSRYAAEQMDFRLVRRSSAGVLEREWNLLRSAMDGIYSWSLTHAGEESALITVTENANVDAGIRVSGFLLAEGPEPQLQFSDYLPSPKSANWVVQTQPAPQGDVWLVWEDRRGMLLGYGEQARITRLDVLDANTIVDDPAQPAAFRLEPNRPNPFNPETTLRFTLAQAGPVRLEVFNLAGQRVRVLQDGELDAGAHSLRFDARDEAGRELASGLYLYRLSAAGRQETSRMLLLR